MTEEGKKDWYDNKTLYEMMVDLSKRLESFGAELGKTQVLIRDYNGLRETINECVRRLDQHEGQSQGSESTVRFGWEKMGYIVGIAGLMVAILSIAVK